MINLFPINDKHSRTDQFQGKLLTLAAFILIFFAVTISLSPMIRYRGLAPGYRYEHWLGVFIWVISFGMLNHASSKKLPHRDPFILPVIALLTGIGLMTIWRLYPNLGLRQSIWIIIGSSIVFLGINFPEFMEYLRRYKYIWLITGLLLTGLTILSGSNPTGNGPKLWLTFLGMHFQPSELLKIILIIYLASFFTDRMVAVQKKLSILLPTLLVVSSTLVILVVQRDFGTGAIFLLIYLGFIFSTRHKKQMLFIAPIIIIVSTVAAYYFFDVVRMRFDSWLNPFGDPTGGSYQVLQSIIAIAEGGIMGTGPGLGSPSLVPVAVSDFIYSAILEELGFLGGCLVISLLILLIYRGIRLIKLTDHSFDRYLAVGLVFYFGVQSILIIGGNIGLFPLTGVTLPFVSYGGSSLVISFIAMLLLILISNRVSYGVQKELPELRRPIVISSLLIFLLSLEIIITSFESFWFMSALINRPENPRWVIDDRFSQRGNILDRDNQVIISSTGEVGAYQRTSQYIPLYPIVGYTNATYGQTGIEETMFEYLRGYLGYPSIQIFWHELLYNQPPEGLNVRSTIDLELQTLADDFLGDEKGAIVMLNAQTGEILTMASHPYFDASELDDNWQILLNDENSPLVNRATQGLYPAGSSLFPFIATSQKDFIQANENPETILTSPLQLKSCTSYPEEELTWQLIISLGCQDLQVQLAEKTGVNSLVDLYQNLGFFSPPDIRLNVAQTAPPETSDPEAFFQGENVFNISPLQLALAVSSLTNQGILPAPRIINGYQNYQGNWITLPKLGQNTQAIDQTSAEWITSLLKEEDLPIWQLTSTISTENKSLITWYIAGTTTEWQGQPAAVVVLLESEAPDLAEKIGTALMENIIQSAAEEN